MANLVASGIRSSCAKYRFVGGYRSISSLTAYTSSPTSLPSTNLGEATSSASPPSSPSCVRARHAHSAVASHPLVRRSNANRMRTPARIRAVSDRTGDIDAFNESLDSLQDLKTFLTKVGTDSKEARYWLKHFQESSALDSSPFAVVFVPGKLLNDAHSVNALASTLAFLQRNNMRTVLVHGVRPRKLVHELQVANLLSSQDVSFADTPWAKLRAAQNLLDSNSMHLVDSLGKNHCFSQLIPATSIFYVGSAYEGDDHSQLVSPSMCSVDANLINWSLRQGFIPIVPAIAQSADGRVIHLEPFDAVAALVRTLQPRKVILLNQAGAIVNMTTGSKVSEINCPGDNANILGQPWCTGRLKEKMQRILAMLDTLPENGSVVLTSPMTILSELFTHHGAGTIFQKRDRIVAYTSLDDVDIDRVRDLLCRSFNYELKANYFEELKPKLEKIYLSESYQFAAIVTREKGAEGVPYVDKFAVSSKNQGQGSSQALWDLLRHDFPSLFWRSFHENRVNSWYYPRCAGFQKVGKWKIFWYGSIDYELSQKLVKVATALPESFIGLRPDGAPEEVDLSRPASWHQEPVNIGPAGTSKPKPTPNNETLMQLALEGI